VVDVAQLVRAPGCGPGGRGFKSRHSPQSDKVYWGPLAQLAEHPPFKRGVDGSSPSWPTRNFFLARVAELADAQDLGSCAPGA
jgi:hypothetical protein